MIKMERPETDVFDNDHLALQRHVFCLLQGGKQCSSGMSGCQKMTRTRYYTVLQRNSRDVKAVLSSATGEVASTAVTQDLGCAIYSLSLTGMVIMSAWGARGSIRWRFSVHCDGDYECLNSSQQEQPRLGFM